MVEQANGTKKQAAFKIAGVEYPIVNDFTLGDPILISEITGLDFPVFLEKLKADEERAKEAEELGEEPSRDPVLLAGLVAASVWRVNKKWSRDKVMNFVERTSFDALEVEGDDEESAEVAPNGPPDMDGVS